MTFHRVWITWLGFGLGVEAFALYKNHKTGWGTFCEFVRYSSGMYPVTRYRRVSVVVFGGTLVWFFCHIVKRGLTG